MIRNAFYLSALLSATLLHAEPTWKAGAAAIVITPSEPIWMSGYAARTAPAAGKETDVFAKALALEDATGNRGLIMTLDLVGIDRGMTGRIAKVLKEKYGLSRDSITFCTSHTHSGPALPGTLAPLHYIQMEPEMQKKIEAYAEELLRKTVEVTGQAIAAMAPARLQWGSGKTTFAVNRRENKGVNVPELRNLGELKGPVNHDVPVLSVRGMDGSIRAVLCGYACHATTLGDQTWNADYPGYAQAALEKQYPGAVALFWQGCGADQNPIPRKELALAEHYGAELAGRVIDVLNAPMTVIPPALSHAYQEIDAPLDPVPTEEELKETLKSDQKYEVARAKYLLQKIEKEGPLRASYPYPIAVWNLGGEVDFIFLGGEVVVDYVNRLTKERHGLATWVASYSNDVMAYIPSLRVLKEGGYEGGLSNVYYGLPALWSENIEETIVSGVHRLGAVRGYPAPVREVYYPVPEDGSMQPTLFWSPDLPAGEKAPLLVCFHTWSDNYLQAGGEAKYAEWCLKNGWIFLHPNFRGPNSTPEAMGSDLAIADIRAAVEWAKSHAPVDVDRIYAVGASGGGHMAELVAGRLPDIWAGVSAWVGISDIAAWHADTTAAKRGGYATNIESALGGSPADSDQRRADAAHRSPLSWLENAKGVPLDINHGVDDGRSGSVPFTHSLRAFNKVAAESDRIPEQELSDWYADPQTLPRDEKLNDPLYCNNPPLYRKTSGNSRVTIFQGGHQIIHQAALNWLAAQRKGHPANWSPTKVTDLQTTEDDRASGK